MKVCVFGVWHLGSVTAACLAQLGHAVIGLDPDAARVAALARGVPPLFEPGLEDAVRRGLESGRLAFTDSAAHACAAIEVLWVAFDTPVDEDDVADVGYVVDEIVRVLPHLPPHTVVLVSSQMPVGSIRQLERIAAERHAAQALLFACAPENLRLGKAIDVFLHPDRIVAGVRDATVRARLKPLLESITPNIEWMSVESAEMTKHAINAFLATSVVFANEIAAICEKVGADAKEVERGLKSESRIGPKAYLGPGAAFAGGTLARDIAFLGDAAHHGGLSTPLLASVRPSNEQHKRWARRRLQESLPQLDGAAVAVWGLTYKPGTDTLRRSAAVELVDWLLRCGAHVHVHDPAVPELPAAWQGRVRRHADPLDAARSAQAVVLCTEWPQYRDLGAASLPPGLWVLDANRFLRNVAAADGVRYLGVGTPEAK